MSSARVGIVIQARMGSSRLPGKVLVDINGASTLERVVGRCRGSNRANGVVLATSTRASDSAVESAGQRLGVDVFRGSESDVLSRIAGAAVHFGFDVVVRVTCDNPLVDPAIIDFSIEHHLRHGCSGTTCFSSRTFPNGTIVSTFDTKWLAELAAHNTDPAIAEHLVYALDDVEPPEHACELVAPARWARYDLRYCVDTPADLELVRRLVTHFDAAGVDPTTEEISFFLDSNPSIKALNHELAVGGY